MGDAVLEHGAPLSVGETYAVYLVPADPPGMEATAAYDVAGSVGVWVVEDGSGELIVRKSDLPDHIEVSVDDAGLLDVRASG